VAALSLLNLRAQSNSKVWYKPCCQRCNRRQRRSFVWKAPKCCACTYNFSKCKCWTLLRIPKKRQRNLARLSSWLSLQTNCLSSLTITSTAFVMRSARPYYTSRALSWTSKEPLHKNNLMDCKCYVLTCLRAGLMRWLNLSRKWLRWKLRWPNSCSAMLRHSCRRSSL